MAHQSYANGVISILCFICAVLVLRTSVSSADSIPIQSWLDPLYTCRVELSVSATRPGIYEIDLPEEKIAQLIQQVSPEPTTADAYAYDSLIVTTSDGRKIGEYKLRIEGENIVKHGDFDPSISVTDSPWAKPGVDGWTIKKRQDGINTFWMEPDKIEGKPYELVIPYQTLDLEQGALYLIRYEIYMDAQIGYGAETVGGPVRLSHPVRWYSELPGSYVPWMPEQRKWVSQQLLQRAIVPQAKLRLNTAITGKIGFANIRINKAAWHLIVNIPQAGEQTIYIYYTPRGGKQVTAPASDRMIEDQPARLSPVNEPVVRTPVDSNDYFYTETETIKAWTIDSTLPLLVDRLAATRPRKPSGDPVKVSLARGERRTLLLAVQADTAVFTMDRVKSNLPVDIKVQRIAAIPTHYAGIDSRLVETRLDALVDVNDPLVPMHKDAPQVLAITLYADEKVKAGKHSGKITFPIKTAYPKSVTINLPIDVSVIPVTVKPMKHFRTNFGGHLLSATFGRDESIPPARFHGLQVEDRYNRVAGMDVMLKYKKIDPDPLRNLADAYWDDLLNYYIQPMTPTLYYPLLFKVTETSKDGSTAPKLSDWDWTLYDRGIKKFVKGRGVTCFTLLHTNGGRMSIMHMPGVTYGLAPSSSSYKPYKQLKPDAYYNLIGDFFEEWAKHLGKLGVLDNAYICCDECTPDTFDVITRWTAALKSRPHAKKIKIYWTLGQGAYYTKTVDGKPGSKLMLQDAFDFVAPANDDSYSLFNPGFWPKERGASPDKWVYYMTTERLLITSAGLNTLLTPLQLEQYGIQGLHYWALNFWSYIDTCNPWVNANAVWGAGNACFYYPPDPRGISLVPTNKVVASYRLALLREGIEDRALLEILKKGKDDTGKPLKVSKKKLNDLRQELNKMWINPVQWRISRPLYHQWKKELYSLLSESAGGK